MSANIATVPSRGSWYLGLLSESGLKQPVTTTNIEPQLQAQGENASLSLFFNHSVSASYFSFSMTSLLLHPAIATMALSHFTFDLHKATILVGVKGVVGYLWFIGDGHFCCDIISHHPSCFLLFKTLPGSCKEKPKFLSLVLEKQDQFHLLITAWHVSMLLWKCESTPRVNHGILQVAFWLFCAWALLTDFTSLHDWVHHHNT
jgi:hypothetical protein